MLSWEVSTKALEIPNKNLTILECLHKRRECLMTESIDKKENVESSRQELSKTEKSCSTCIRLSAHIIVCKKLANTLQTTPEVTVESTARTIAFVDMFTTWGPKPVRVHQPSQCRRKLN